VVAQSQLGLGLSAATEILKRRCPV